MRFRRALCVVLTAGVMCADSRVWAQEPPKSDLEEAIRRMQGRVKGMTRLKLLPASACRPECEPARQRWAAAEQAVDRASRENFEAVRESRQRADELEIAERLLRESKDAIPTDLTRARVAAREALAEARTKENDSYRRLQQEVEILNKAYDDYQACCGERKKSRVPLWASIVAGAGATVALVAGTGSDDPTSTTASVTPEPIASTPPPTPSPQPSPTPPAPTPTPAPAPPPATPTPTSGSVGNADPGGLRIYPFLFSNSNVDQTLSVTLALINTNCNPRFFNERFTSQITISGTGPYSPAGGVITGSGSGSFLIGGQQIRGQLTMTFTGNMLEVSEHLENLTLNCFGDFFGRVVVAGF